MSDELMVVPKSVSLGTLQAHTPGEMLESAAAMAKPLAKVIKDCKLDVVLSGRSYVKCEGWTTLAAMMGVTPHEVSVEEHDGVFVAKVEFRKIADGTVISSASAECGSPDELDRSGKPTWASRPRYARRSMALTRATAKAARMAFSWVMTLAGYEATPYEEMEGVIDVQPVVTTVPNIPAAAQQFAAQHDMNAPDIDGEPRGEGGVYCTAVERKQQGNGPKGAWNLWLLKFSDGKEGTTFEDSFAASGEASKANHIPMLTTWGPNSKYPGKFTLLNLERA